MQYGSNIHSYMLTTSEIAIWFFFPESDCCKSSILLTYFLALQECLECSLILFENVYLLSASQFQSHFMKHDT